MRILILSIFLVFSLTACVSNPARDTSTNEQSSPYKKKIEHNHDHGPKGAR